MALPIKRIAVVGSGPAGMYTTMKLLRLFNPNNAPDHTISRNAALKIDVFEKHKVPYGLLRFGVAPDHTDLNPLYSQFDALFDNQPHGHTVKFFGNVEVGDSGNPARVSIKELQLRYDAVVLAYGAQSNKSLDLPGEDAHGVYSAREFVGWYNGSPDYMHVNPALNSQTALIIGQGNVSLDIARVLLKQVESFQPSKMSEASQQKLKRENRVQHVTCIGRRGPKNIAFTTKEFREFTRLENTEIVADKDSCFQIAHDAPDITKSEPNNRAKTRLLGLVRDSVKPFDPCRFSAPNKKSLQLKFNLTPIEFVKDMNGHLAAVKFRHSMTSLIYEIKTKLAITSIGYKSLPIDPSVPFDTDKWIVPNVSGKVTFPSNHQKDKSSACDNLFVTGWLKTGPRGVILQTMNSAFETAEIIAAYLTRAGPSKPPEIAASTTEAFLSAKKIEYITFDECKRPYFPTK